MSKYMGVWKSIVVLLVCAAAIAAMTGCESDGAKPAEKPEVAATIRKDPPPTYVATARAFNEKVRYLDRIFARANLKLTYFDRDGVEKSEDPEGRLQIVRPNKLALSLGKAGTTLFWFGSDADRYWWLDMSDSKKMFAAVGKHANYGASAAKRIGIAVQPLDLIALLGVVPLDASAPGATQWSADGQQLGVTTALGTRGTLRLWLEPTSLDVQEVEIFNTKRELELTARHEGSQSVEITRDLPPGTKVARIRISERVYVWHYESKTEVRLTLSGVKDGPVSDKAFDLEELLSKFEIQKVIDLDAPRGQ